MPSQSDPISLRLALPDLLDGLIPFVHAYHRTEGIDSDVRELPRVLLPLLADNGEGRIWFIDVSDRPIGYVALCFGYSIEFGGRDAFVDEIYLEPEYRGRGIGGRALTLVIAAARSYGVRALHLEVDSNNQPALRLYRAKGFQARSRYQLMSQDLAAPA